MSIGPFILLLPDNVLEAIFSFLTYDDIAKNRLVCKKFNDVGSNLLSRGFMQIEKKHAAIFKRVKSMLPRRESERRVHPLFRHCDILSAVETRISMLNMTYMKYIQNNLCCFNPGKVLDELDRVLGIVEKSGTPPKTHEILQELRDISSMAMEYFDEKILPTIKCHTTSSLMSFAPSVSRVPKVYVVQPGVQEEVLKVAKLNKKQKEQIMCLSKIVHKLYNKIEKQSVTIKHQTNLIQEHETKLKEQAGKLQEQDSAICSIQKQMSEWDQKFSDLNTEVAKSQDVLARSVFAPEPLLSSHPSNRTFTRPRLSHTKTPNAYLMELERKRKSSMEIDIPHKLRFITTPNLSGLNLKDHVNMKIDENITQNISQNIRRGQLPGEKLKQHDVVGELGSFISSSIEAILKNPLTGIKSRKRRSADDLDLSGLD